jgi:hypothetical protein
MIGTCVAISCNYDTLPNFNSDDMFNNFRGWASTGMVSNTGSLSSTDVCNFLKSKGLPGGWIAF